MNIYFDLFERGMITRRDSIQMKKSPKSKGWQMGIFSFNSYFCSYQTTVDQMASVRISYHSNFYNNKLYTGFLIFGRLLVLSYEAPEANKFKIFLNNLCKRVEDECDLT